GVLGRHARGPLLVVPEAGLLHLALERADALAQPGWVKGSPRAASAGRGGRRQRASCAYAPWHFLNFLPDPHQQGSLRPICSRSSTCRVSIWTGISTSCSANSASATPAGTTPAAAAASALGWSSAVPPWYWSRPVVVDAGDACH